MKPLKSCLRKNRYKDHTKSMITRLCMFSRGMDDTERLTLFAFDELEPRQKIFHSINFVSEIL